MVYLRVAIIVGILLALPVILYQLWAFVAPGPAARGAPGRPALDPHDRGLLPAGHAWWPGSRCPTRSASCSSFQIEGSLTALPSAEAYFGFVTFIFLLFGLVMQFPIVLIFLDRLGVLQRGPAARRCAATCCWAWSSSRS